MRINKQTLAICALLVAAVGLTGCGNVGNDDDAEVAGSYSASTFAVETDTATADVLEEGGLLRIRLKEDGTASGRLFLPCSLPGACEADEGDAFKANFEGIYEVDNNIVRFDHRADTFIRDVEWTYRDGTLRTSFEDDGVRITVELTRE